MNDKIKNNVKIKKEPMNSVKYNVTSKKVGEGILVPETDERLFTLQINLEISRAFWVVHFKRLAIKYITCLILQNNAKTMVSSSSPIKIGHPFLDKFTIRPSPSACKFNYFPI